MQIQVTCKSAYINMSSETREKIFNIGLPLIVDLTLFSKLYFFLALIGILFFNYNIIIVNLLFIFISCGS